MKITEKQWDKMWGVNGPYSQANLITEVRILDDKISRVFLVVEVEINPFTYEMIKKNRACFQNDLMVQQLLDTAEYRGIKFGYVSCAFEVEYLNENVMDEAKRRLKYCNEMIIKIHRFVMKALKTKL